MSLTRYLPLPSDRMGILWNLLSIEGSIVLEYGPAGTTHYSMSLFGELGVDRENCLFTTHMSEDDVVMGDVSRLEQALVEIDESYHPEVIFVVASSIAAVIGTDIKGVCRYMQNRVNAKLVAFDQGGFRGDYSVGCQAVWSLLAEELVEPAAEKKTDTFNLLGVSAGSYRMQSDVWELCNLLKEAFGLKHGVSFCMDTSVQGLREAGSAAINLVLREEALPCAYTLEQKCGTPYYLGIPYGYQGTIAWLAEIGKLLGKEPDPALMDRLREKAEKASMYRMYGMMLKKDRPGAILVGEYHTIKGISAFLQQIGIPAENKLCLHTLRTIEEPDGSIVHLDTEKKRIDLLGTVHKQLVLGDDISMRMCPSDNTFYRIALPIIYGSQVAAHMPIAGEKGADAMLEKVDEYFQLVH